MSLCIGSGTVVFGRINVMDNPSNSFSFSLWSSVGITVSGWGRQTLLFFFCWRWSHLWWSEIWVHRVPFEFACFEHLLEIRGDTVSSLCSKTVAFLSLCFLLKCSITLWITALFKSLPPLSTHFIVFRACRKSEWVWVFSARRAVIGGRSLTGVSLSWAQGAQQIDSPCLLPFSTDRLRAWALSQHYQSIRSYPQPLTLIGAQLPKGQGSMNHGPAMKSCCASKYTCWGSKSLCHLAINDNPASVCHEPRTKLSSI